jgi:uncharacterized membrane protein
MERNEPIKPEDRRIADPGVEDRDAHPVGTTTGTGAGASIGAVAGATFGGPVGAVVGGVIGGALGAATGHATAAAVHPEGDAVDGDVIPDPGTDGTRSSIDDAVVVDDRQDWDRH